VSVVFDAAWAVLKMGLRLKPSHHNHFLTWQNQ